MILLTTDSVAQTQSLGAALAELVRAGDVIYLDGDLGAGKTAFTQGLVAGLGFDGRVTSPTFALLQHYEAEALTIHHVDAYRLNSPREAEELALPEVLDGSSIMIIEWAERLGINLVEDRLEIALLLGDDDDERQFRVQAVGQTWRARVDELERVLAPWCTEVRGDV